ncbi:MAG: hypothetical protein QGF53_11370 [Alphaproteobacteria bacterium]|nr:hypothetical protein [Alphaproteobacteria bacterium]
MADDEGQEGITERVAAILAADAVGYSRLMADDEKATIAALDRARTVFIEHIEANRGRVVDTAGDSVLAVFETAPFDHSGTPPTLKSLGFPIEEAQFSPALVTNGSHVDH